MEYYKIIFISLLILFVSISVVSAENDNSTDCNENDVYEAHIDFEIENASFTKLNHDINNSHGEISLSQDYKYVKKDFNYRNGVVISSDLIINGNNHVIDGSNLANIFKITNSTVTINNLVIKNSPTNAINATNSTIITNNVTFINNTKENAGACLFAKNTTYTSINDKFIDNYARYGSGMCLIDNSTLNLINAQFKNTAEINRGLIALQQSWMMIVNTTFSNIRCNYSGVIYAIESRGIIKNCNFINIYADKTAGSIAVLGLDDTLSIENCTFINSTSRKNGGAVYVDLGETPDKNITLKDCEFIDCSSAFGGAYLQLDGNLNITNSKFENNINPIYLTGTNTTLTSTQFSTNPEGIYFDNGFLKITNCEFEKSSEIYIYASRYNITSSNFTQTDINTYFDLKNSILNDNNIFKYSNANLNQETYTSVILNNLTQTYTYKETVFISETIHKSYFNLKDYGLVTPVQDQGNSGSCWAFAVASAFESALLKMGINMTISVNNIKNLAMKYSRYGEAQITDGGDYEYATDYLASWLGPICEAEDDFDDLGKISALSSLTHQHFTFTIVGIEYDFNDEIRPVKEALLKYGAVYASIYADYDNSEYYNEETSAAYYDEWTFWNNHAVCIVGWDDNYSKYNFANTPKGNGAWIVKNSWGDEWGDDGYFYVSYWDYSITPCIAFKINPEIYNKNYQYNFISYNDFFDTGDYDTLLDSTYGSYYTSQGDDLIAAIGTYFLFKEDLYTIKIYINDKLVYTQEGESEFDGFNTIKLNSLISVNKNDVFRVEIKSSLIPVATDSRVIYPQNTSYYISKNKMHFFKQDTTAILKVYTLENPIKTKNMVTYFTGNETWFKIENITGDTITVKVDGVKYTLNIQDNIAELPVKLKVGNHIITTLYQSRNIINQILVKSTIISDRILYVAYHGKVTFNVKFVDGNGNPVKNQKVKAKFGKKSISGTTDDEGIFKFTPKNTLKKGTYYITLTNPTNNEGAKLTVKVISRFKQAKSMKMYYFDGSSYKFRVINADGSYASNVKVKIKLKHKTYNLKSDENGWVKVKISSKILPGKHKIKLKYKGDTIKHTIIVKNILKVKKTTKGKKLILKAILKKKLAGKKITFKFKGKKYTVKTNKKGVGEIKIKKPKKGKYRLKVKYYKSSVKTTVKI